MAERPRDARIAVLPLTRSRATDIVREVARAGRWSINVQYRPTEEWRRLVNRRQIESCLLEGYVLDDKAELDDNDNWRFQIARVCGGLNVVVDVALQRSAALPRLYVIAIKGDQIDCGG